MQKGPRQLAGKFRALHLASARPGEIGVSEKGAPAAPGTQSRVKGEGSGAECAVRSMARAALEPLGVGGFRRLLTLDSGPLATNSLFLPAPCFPKSPRKKPLLPSHRPPPPWQNARLVSWALVRLGTRVATNRHRLNTGFKCSRHMPLYLSWLVRERGERGPGNEGALAPAEGYREKETRAGR